MGILCTMHAILPSFNPLAAWFTQGRIRGSGWGVPALAAACLALARSEQDNEWVGRGSVSACYRAAVGPTCGAAELGPPKTPPHVVVSVNGLAAHPVVAPECSVQ